MLEQSRQTIEQLTAGWNDPTQVDWGTEETMEPTENVQVERAPTVSLLKCTALYSYTVRVTIFVLNFPPISILKDYTFFRRKIPTN